jgi:hypothetical protein
MLCDRNNRKAEVAIQRAPGDEPTEERSRIEFLIARDELPATVEWVHTTSASSPTYVGVSSWRWSLHCGHAGWGVYSAIVY